MLIDSTLSWTMTGKVFIVLLSLLHVHRVMVLDEGKIVEFDTPGKLLELRGLFYRLVTDAGLNISN